MSNVDKFCEGILEFMNISKDAFENMNARITAVENALHAQQEKKPIEGANPKIYSLDRFKKEIVREEDC